MVKIATCLVLITVLYDMYLFHENSTGYTLGSDIWGYDILYGKMVGDDFLFDKLVTRNNYYFERIIFPGDIG